MSEIANARLLKAETLRFLVMTVKRLAETRGSTMENPAVMAVALA
jgi:hypothetical protein